MKGIWIVGGSVDISRELAREEIRRAGFEEADLDHIEIRITPRSYKVGGGSAQSGEMLSYQVLVDRRGGTPYFWNALRMAMSEVGHALHPPDIDSISGDGG